jgi:hypothetical protein
LKFEYLQKFEPELENVLGYELGVHMGSIHEKNQGPKISCYCTFKSQALEESFKDEGQVKETSLHPPSPALGININQPEADIVNSTQNVVHEGRVPRGSAWRQREAKI